MSDVRVLGADACPGAWIGVAVCGAEVRAYLDARRWTEAAAIARPCLEARLRKQPDDWLRYHPMSQLGAALAGAAK